MVGVHESLPSVDDLPCRPLCSTEYLAKRRLLLQCSHMPSPDVRVPTQRLPQHSVIHLAELAEHVEFPAWLHSFPLP